MVTHALARHPLKTGGRWIKVRLLTAMGESDVQYADGDGKIRTDGLAGEWETTPDPEGPCRITLTVLTTVEHAEAVRAALGAAAASIPNATYRDDAIVERG